MSNTVRDVPAPDLDQIPAGLVERIEVVTLHYATWSAYDFYNARIPSYNYLDLEATWNVNKIVQIRAGANNVLDKDPPPVDSVLVAGSAANSYSLYDMFGRQLFLAFTAKF